MPCRSSALSACPCVGASTASPCSRGYDTRVLQRVLCTLGSCCLELGLAEAVIHKN